jgi:two-component system nitrogen regulation response regulator GlnG
MREILIVEDNEEFRTAFADTLKSRFPNLLVSQAGDGPEALQKIGHKPPPDLIFMDLRLPGASGLELTKVVKETNASTVVIVLTHMDSLEYREAALRCGADFFLSKETARPEGILTLVERVLA